MKLIVDIPEFAFMAIKDYGLENCKPMLIHNISNAIKNGTPLPEGYGRYDPYTDTFIKIDSPHLKDILSDVTISIPDGGVQNDERRSNL